MDGDWWPVASGQWFVIAAHLSEEGRRRRPPRPRCRPTTSHWPPPIHASSLSGIAAGKFGEGAGRPGLARSVDSCTVSTKPDLGRPSDPPVKSRSGRDGAAPRSRFPRALRLAALASGLTGSPPMTLLPATRGGHETAARSGSARRAGGGHPSTSTRTPEVSIPRASSLDHSPPTSGRWIRRPPHRRDEKSLTRAPARMVCDAVYY